MIQSKELKIKPNVKKTEEMNVKKLFLITKIPDRREIVIKIQCPN